MKRYLIVGASSDISTFLMRRYLSAGDMVWGTFRTWSPALSKLKERGARFSEMDIQKPEEIDEFAQFVRSEGYEWDVLISAVGLLSPIGPFFSLDADVWQDSVIINSLSQLRTIRALFPARNKRDLARVILFAGGGTNGPFDNYSAYCLGKLILIKACELLDSEEKQLCISIIGTGWVNTKIHSQTLNAGELAGPNLDKTINFINEPETNQTTLDEVGDCLDWCLSAPRAAVGGRNFSLVHDNWRDLALIENLIGDPDLGKLRRHW